MCTLSPAIGRNVFLPAFEIGKPVIKKDHFKRVEIKLSAAVQVCTGSLKLLAYSSMALFLIMAMAPLTNKAFSQAGSMLMLLSLQSTYKDIKKSLDMYEFSLQEQRCLEEENSLTKLSAIKDEIRETGAVVHDLPFRKKKKGNHFIQAYGAQDVKEGQVVYLWEKDKNIYSKAIVKSDDSDRGYAHYAELTGEVIASDKIIDNIVFSLCV